MIAANTGEWVDESFTFPDAIFWKDMRPTSPGDDQSARAEDTQWLRISDVFDPSEYSLWGSEEISPKDTIQGYLGDCWVHTAAASVAQDPARIK